MSRTITVEHKGDLKNTIAWLRRLQRDDGQKLLVQYGTKAITNLQLNTPVDTGLTANSYKLDIRKTSYGFEAIISNTNVTADGVPVPLLLHYGHGTGTGGYVAARPFIDSAIRPVNEEYSSAVERRLRNG